MVFKERFIQARTLYRWVLFPWQKIVYQVVWQFCRISHANLSAPKPNPPLSNFDANVVLTFQQLSLQQACLGMSSFPGESRAFDWHLALPNLSLTLLPPCSLSLSPTGHSLPSVPVSGKLRGAVPVLRLTVVAQL